MLNFTERDGAITFQVKVVPRASKSSIVGVQDGALRIRVAAPPVDGAANEELIRILSKALRLPSSSIEIIVGQGSKTKLIRATGITGQQIKELLEAR
jgi:uncharacterized protein